MSKNRRVFHTEDIYTKQDFNNEFNDVDFDNFSPYNQQQQQQQKESAHQYADINPNMTRIPHTAGKLFSNIVKPKIDPNVLPSPVDELANDIAHWDSNFNPNNTISTLDVQVDLPSATIPFRSVDHGYSAPNYMRLTSYALPSTHDLAKACQLPLGLVLDPFNDRPSSQIPSIDSFTSAEGGPPRCAGCRGYINPSVKFTNGGKYWLCNLCQFSNTVEDDYFSTLDPHTYRRLDIDNRPELNFGTVDFNLPKSYHAFQPTPIGMNDGPPFNLNKTRDPTTMSRLFLIDVGLQSRQSGLLHTLSLTIKDALYSSPTPLNTSKVGFITYDSTLHFHDLSPERDLPSLMIVPDTEEPFNPLVNGLIVDVNESKHNILAFLNSLPTMFEDVSPKGSIFGSALTAGLDVLSEVGGEMNIFQSQLPNEGLGALTERDPAPGGTASVAERDRALYGPATTWWSNTAEALIDAGIGLNVFMFPFKYTDVGTLSSIAQYTGGESYFYPKFDPARHALKIRSDLQRIVTRHVGYNATIKIRCSKGFHIDQHYGSFMQRNSTDIEMGTLSSDSCLAASLEHDAASLTKGWGTMATNAINQAKEGGASQQNDDEIHFQAAILYTSSDGQRKVRVLNSMAKLSPIAATVFRHADMDAGAVLLYKQAAMNVLNKPLKKIHEKLTDRSVQVLLAYRKHCAQANSGGQLILPESYKLLPILTLGMMKSKCLKGGAVASDVRSHAIRQVLSGTPYKLLQSIYPRLHPLHRGAEHVPDFIRSSYKRMDPSGAYLIHNGELAIIWLGKQVDKQIVKDIWNVDAKNAIDQRMGVLPDLDNPLSISLRSIIYRSSFPNPPSSIPVLVARQDIDPTEIEVGNMLIEDDNNDNMSYIDHICQIHKLINTQIIGETRMADAADAATWRTW
ncbi:hypothetical protein E3Q17_04308 [Wallemia mellicola]|uniref:Beta-sandwich domain of Sec23/24 n=1 Tax=Wallemia mellicola TaxID=1708541 RepID=A0A4T0NEN9_9BASI|nr:hypothetical protein E3Q17_04308 [Wallemia mellicola]